MENKMAEKKITILLDAALELGFQGASDAAIQLSDAYEDAGDDYASAVLKSFAKSLRDRKTHSKELH